MEMDEFVRTVFDEQYRAVFGEGQDLISSQQEIVLVEEEAGQLVAVLQAQQTLETIHVKALVVAKDKQGQGLGSRLLTRLENEARQGGVRSITLSTKSYQAKDFYMKAGYSIYAHLTDVPKKGIIKYHFIKWL
ncbi:TPA: GNAT family N-acetyltransferase [Streptococcus suis]|nr:GNAT family N-acetyltransferase [Streptococcus suis]HEM6310515.1 GNAT family N-acetyltransferase [Streptococcus suis]